MFWFRCILKKIANLEIKIVKLFSWYFTPLSPLGNLEKFEYLKQSSFILLILSKFYTISIWEILSNDSDFITFINLPRNIICKCKYGTVNDKIHTGKWNKHHYHTAIHATCTQTWALLIIINNVRTRNTTLGLLIQLEELEIYWKSSKRGVEWGGNLNRGRSNFLKNPKSRKRIGCSQDRLNESLEKIWF